MANKNSNKNSVKTESNNNSGLPLVIIGIVLLVAVVGGWYLYQSSSKKTPVANSNTRTNTTTQQPNNTTLTSSVLGAQPPHFKGGQNASVTVEEFADYQCPTCAVMHPVMNEINAAYGSRIKFIYRNYPLVQIHKNAYEAASSAEAAGLQGKFWEMQNLLFQNQRNWSNVADAKPVFEGYAQTIGLDVEKFKADVLGVRARERVDLDLRRAQSLNLSSTPSVLINGKPVPFEQMTVDGMKQMIDAELAQTSSQQTTQPASTASANKSDEEKGIEKAPANAANSNAKK
ncbi:thioredoxin domain-containing protein [soil metagenome]